MDALAQSEVSYFPPLAFKILLFRFSLPSMDLLCA